jgi:parallel beta-helix repeat protein
MKHTLKIFLVSLVLVLATHGIGLATVITVPGDQPTIQQGLNVAQPGDTVLVAPGTYYENIIWPETNGIKLLSEAGAESTTINGRKLNSVITFPAHGGRDTTTVVRGFRITNGRRDHGGGIACYYSGPTLTNCIISGNSANGGGGIHCAHSNATLTNCTISGNSAEVEAGGIWCNTSDLTFTNCTISGNSAVSLAGGIYCERQSMDTTLNPTFTNCTISGNSTGGDGGGILLDFSSKPSIKHCTITDNRASDTADGIYIIHGSWPTLDSNNIYYNGYGVFKDTLPLLMAENQWWGHASGPYHPDYNPYGQGDSVNSFVDPRPYLTEADTIAPPIPPVGLDTVQVWEDSISLVWLASLIGDLAGYKVYFRSDSSGFPYSDTINVGLDTSLTLIELTTGTTYYIAVTCYDNSGNESWYSREIHATPGGCVRGDANCDGAINASDVVYLINYLFISGPAPQPLAAGDANCDGNVNASDVVYLINYLFISGPPPGC